MYVALWIDESKDSANEKIVICKPLLQRLNAALAVLNAEKRKDAPSMIFSGDPERLQRFVQEIEKLDDSLGNIETGVLVDGLARLADYTGVSTVPFPTEATAAKPIRRIPKPGYYPRYITREAKPIWDMVVKQHKKTIDKYKQDKMRMWAAAIVIFKRYAAQEGVAPFSKDASQEKFNQALINDLHKVINRGNSKALSESERIFEKLYEAGLVARLTTEKFYEVATRNAQYYITTYRWAKLRKGIQPKDVLGWLMLNGYRGQPGKYATLWIDQSTDLLVEPEGKDVYFYIVTTLTRAQLNTLFELDETADPKKILKRLGTAGRRWVKTGTLVEIKKTR